MAHEALFEPITIGPVEVKNRLALAPTNTNYSDKHLAGDQTLAWYAARARGGLGLIIFEATPVSPEAAETSIYNIHHFWGPEHLPGMRHLIEAVHSWGAKIFIQLSPGLGIQAAMKGSGIIPRAPSAVSLKIEMENTPESLLNWYLRNPNMILSLEGEVPTPLTVEEIEARVSAFVRASVLAINIGFDGVEIHSPHGYLVHDFLSPRYNKRTDQYGGSLENRMRFLLQLITETKAVIQNRIAFGARFSLDERNADGIHYDEMVKVVKKAVETGLDYVHVSDGCYEQTKYFLPDEDGTMLNGARGFREIAGVPVITPNLHNPDTAASAVRGGYTDMVSSSRAFIADPEWANKVAHKKAHTIKKCIRCNRCIFELINGRHVRCSVNKDVGFDRFNLNEIKKKDLHSRSHNKKG